MGGKGLNMRIDHIVSEPQTEFSSKLPPRQNGEENRPNCGEYKLINDKLSEEFLWVAAIVLSVEMGVTGKDN